MDLNNKYTILYLSIIIKAKNEIRNKKQGYYEKHHIYPKSIWPEYKNDNWNLVLLTAKEHFICHKLLTKMFDNSTYKQKMYYALWGMMNQENKFQNRKYKINSKSYENVRLKISELSSKNLKSLHKNKDFAANHSEISRKRLIEMNSDPDFAKKRNELLKKINSDPDFCKKRKERARKQMIKLNSDPSFKIKQKENGKIMVKNIQIQKTCEHCHKAYNLGNYSQHHGDKCKLKIINKDLV